MSTYKFCGASTPLVLPPMNFTATWTWRCPHLEIKFYYHSFVGTPNLSFKEKLNVLCEWPFKKSSTIYSCEHVRIVDPCYEASSSRSFTRINSKGQKVKNLVYKKVKNLDLFLKQATTLNRS